MSCGTRRPRSPWVLGEREGRPPDARDASAALTSTVMPTCSTTICTQTGWTSTRAPRANFLDCLRT